MARSVRLLMLAALAGLTPITAVPAEEPAHAAAPATSGASAQQDPLPGFPQVDTAPRSLFALAPPPAPPPPDFERPYFQTDPLLDPPQVPSPGWFADAEATITKAHVKNQLQDTVEVGNLLPVRVGPLGTASLDWTVSPRVDVGYRLPSGFGGFSIGYQGLATQGVSRADEPTGVESLKSRLDINLLDLDYTSREYSLWPDWEMKWWLGTRVAWIYFDSTLNDLALPAALSPIDQHVSNNYVGAGPHAGVELAHRVGDSGLSLVGHVDVTTLMGRIKQDYADPSGETRISSSQGVFLVNGQLGLRWAPPSWPSTNFFLGYQYERWWNVGRLSELASEGRGDITDQGIILQASFNY